jgi:hypothetical protein
MDASGSLRKRGGKTCDGRQYRQGSADIGLCLEIYTQDVGACVERVARARPVGSLRFETRNMKHGGAGVWARASDG